MSLYWFATENLDIRGNTIIPNLDYSGDPVRTEQRIKQRDF